MFGFEAAPSSLLLLNALPARLLGPWEDDVPRNGGLPDKFLGQVERARVASPLLRPMRSRKLFQVASCKDMRVT